ncbi:hypothetical protein [Calycomorphotria hydatis]|nr:hypothetical protein [Calycomorphotria hydatis]
MTVALTAVAAPGRLLGNIPDLAAGAKKQSGECGIRGEAISRLDQQ